MCVLAGVRGIMERNTRYFELGHGATFVSGVTIRKGRIIRDEI